MLHKEDTVIDITLLNNLLAPDNLVNVNDLIWSIWLHTFWFVFFNIKILRLRAVIKYMRLVWNEL